MSVPWDRRIDESPKVFAYFQFWLALGPTRTFTPVAAHFRRTSRNFEILSRKYGWHARADAFDRQNAEKDAKLLEELRTEATMLRGHREIERQNETWSLAMALAQRIRALLAVPVTATAKVPSECGNAGGEPRTVPVHTSAVIPLCALVREYDRLSRSAVQNLIGENQPAAEQGTSAAGMRLVPGAFSLWRESDAPGTAPGPLTIETGSPLPADPSIDAGWSRHQMMDEGHQVAAA